MPHIIPVREYRSAAEMQAHAAAVKARMFAPARPDPVAVPVAPLPVIQENVAPEVVMPETLEVASRPDGFFAIKDMVRVASFCSGQSQRDILGPARTAELVKARQIGFWLARQFTERSLPQIGAVFRRDHTTVLHGLRRVNLAIYSERLPVVWEPINMGFRLWGLKWPRCSKSFSIARPRP